MQALTSLQNPLIKAARSLQTKAGRDETGLFLCEGEHMASEALAAAPERVETVFVDESRMEAFSALLNRAKAYNGIAVYAVPERVLSAISQVKAPQGVCATVRMPAATPLERLGDRLLLLENVQDPGNVGTILRTLDAAGFSGCVLTPGCADPYSPKALRATMGSVFRVPIAYGSALEAVEALNARGYATLAAALDGAPFYQRGPLPRRLCVLIGNEGAGLRPETVALCGHRFRLPMNGGAESLNAAIAAAVMMYDLINR